MKFGQFIEYNKRKIFFKNHAENMAGRLFPAAFLLSKKTLYRVNANDLQLSFNIIR